MKTIQLSRGFETIVDDEVQEALLHHGWYWHYSIGYACTTTGFSKITRRIYLHRWVVDSFYNIPVGGLEVHHKNHNTLDNRLENLQVVTHRQNLRHQQLKKSNTSGFKGVDFNKSTRGKYKAAIMVDGRKVCLGTFVTAEEAAKTYDIAAQLYFGEFALLNFQPSLELGG